MPEKNKAIVVGILLVSFIFLSILLYAKIYYDENPSEVKEQGSLEICFTMQSDCSSFVIDKIEKSSFAKAAFYDLDHEEIIQLLNKKNAEVLVFEDEYTGIGTPIKSIGLMHDKFILLDEYIVITGSANPTFNDYTKNDNNVLAIKSKSIYKNYLEEFEELKMFRKQSQTSKPKVNIQGMRMKNYFCPEDDCEGKIINEIKKANQSIYFMTFSFTSDKIGDVILQNKKLDVRGIFDSSQVAANKEYSEYYRFKEQNLSVKIEVSSGKLHHKVFIIDNKTVITGSYNPTWNGNTRNDENVIIIESEEVAAEFLKEFERIWQAKLPQ